MRTAVPLVALAFVLAGGGCAGDAGRAAPHAGEWVGDHVLFRVQADGRITDVWTRDVACSGHRDGGFPCTARFNAALAGEVVPVAGAFDAPLGPIRFIGRFVSAVEAHGVMHFADPDGCCEGDVAWRATHRPAEFPDATASDVTGAGDAGGGDAAAPGDAEEDIGPADTAAHARAVAAVNAVRARVGVPPVASDEAIRRAAQAHADYFLANCRRDQDAGVSPHREVSGNPGFTGERFDHRMTAQGYSGYAGWEVMSFDDSPETAVAGFLTTLYHRIPLVHPNAVALGYGGGRSRGTDGCPAGMAVDVIDLGQSLADPGAVVARYPTPGQADVAPSWNGREVPTPPLPEGASYPSGPIVTLTFPSGRAVDVHETALLGPTADPIPHVVRTPENDENLRTTVAVYAVAPLAAGTEYSVRFVGTVGGQPFSEAWSFSTR